MEVICIRDLYILVSGKVPQEFNFAEGSFSKNRLLEYVVDLLNGHVRVSVLVSSGTW
jgi:hypothetical protein